MLGTVFLIPLLWSGITCDITHIIRDAQGLIEISRNVSNKTRYEGETVLLDSDIVFTSELSEEFVPIGESWSRSFAGTFDGQGHVIRGLTLNSSSKFVGLFSFARDAKIRNVLIGESCSIVGTSNSTEENAYIGSVVGYCSGKDEVSLIENCVNMASISFEGDFEKSLVIGGIVGSYYSSGYGVIMKNCVNYGTVANYGTAHKSYMGGISGEIIMKSDEKTLVQSCLNYGRIVFNGTSKSLYLGGFVGSVRGGVLENCIALGEITSTHAKGDIGNVLGIIGTNNTAIVTHCHWTNATGYDRLNGYEKEEANATNSYGIELNVTTLAELNVYAAANNFSRWHILHLNGGVIEGFSEDTVVTAEEYFPNVVSEGFTLINWCADLECSSIYDPKTNNVVDLYAQWAPSNYTVVFDFGNGTTAEDVVKYNESIVYPENVERDGYTFDRWDMILTVMPARNITITAMWIPNNYTVTFDFGNGTTAEDVVKYNEIIEYPENVEMDGYTFDGWDKDITTMPARNVTITAMWIPNIYTVTFDFGNGTTAEAVVKYNESVAYPEDVRRNGYTFGGWDKDLTTMPARNVTITTKWTPNNYTLTFNTNGGNELTPKEVRVTFNSTYGELPTPTKEGHSFIGWFTEGNASVTSETVVKTLGDHTLYAHWEEVSNQVEIVFEKKDISDKEIEDIIKVIVADAEFTIVRYEDNETGETRVVIKFTDSMKAEEFVRTVRTSSTASDLIRDVGFSFVRDNSFSALFYPSILFGILML